MTHRSDRTSNIARFRRAITTLAVATVACMSLQCGLVLGLDQFYECPQDPRCPNTDAGTGGGPAEPSCSDGKKNGDETDTDCGGSCTTKCTAMQGCGFGTDCASKVCSAGLCLAPACDDKVQNGLESDTDCGATCMPCQVGKHCATGADCASDVCLDLVCADNYVWANLYGNSNASTMGIAVDAQGNVAVAGSFSGTIDFGGGSIASKGSDDFFVAKLGPGGEHQWSKGYGNSGDQFIISLSGNSIGDVAFAGNFTNTIDFGGGPLTSQGDPFFGDTFVVKLNADGSHSWSKAFHSSTSYANIAGVNIDTAGDTIVVGEFSGSLALGTPALIEQGGKGDVFVAKFDASGSHSWSARFGDAAAEQAASSVAVDSAGNVLVAGVFSGTIDFGGGPLTSSGKDVFLAKLSPSGAHIWSRAFTGFSTKTLVLIHVATDVTGNIVVSGSFGGTVDFGGGPLAGVGGQDIFVAKLDPSGTHMWSKRFGDTQDQTAIATTDPAGNVILAGSCAGTVDFGGGALTSAGDRDVIVAKLDAGGSHVWSHRYGDANAQYGSNVAGATTGTVYLAGFVEGTIDLGAGPITAVGENNALLAKLLVP
ncbi:Hypothetical protein A7982_07003 [Minicystis rosea]|nr:Hypothetical protein A7982_07003 [Minicystis rosea]